MKVMTISNSFEKMEKILFEQDPKDSLKDIEYFIKECEANIEIASQAAIAISQILMIKEEGNIT